MPKSAPRATTARSRSSAEAVRQASQAQLKLKPTNPKNWRDAFRDKQVRKLLKHTAEAKQATLPSWVRPSHPIGRRLRRAARIVFFPILNPYARYLTLILFLVLVSGLVYLLRDLPSPRRLTAKDNFAVSTLIYDRYGTMLYEIFADEHRIPIKLKDLPPHVSQATIAIEDRHFYSHFGFDITGILRAFRNNLSGDSIEGGSTITQQLIKNALLTREKSLKRKAKEAVLSVLTEIIYTKDEILEMYLNYIPYGGTAVGIEAASQKYFNKHAAELTLAEAALLAGLPQAPSRYSPFGSNPNEAKARQAEVLKRMVDDGYITALQAEQAKGEVLNYALSRTDIEAPHFVFFVRDLLYQEYGVETVEKGGLRVTTTLDLPLQQVAQASLSAELESLSRYHISNGAALITKPNTGEILAMIGSKDYFDSEHDGQVNVTLAERQPGSSIKPLMYATAMQQKLLNPGSILLDIPTCFTVPGQRQYCPKNYDGSFRGPVTIRKALGNSLNIPAVKGLRLIGLETFIRQAQAMGISSWLDPSRYGLSLTLGGGEVRMIDLAQAFGVIANQGVKVPLIPILKIEDYQGKVLKEINTVERLRDLAELTTYEDDQTNGELTRVMNRAPAYLTAHIMQDNSARVDAFGPNSQLVIRNQIVSAKTGTTNDLKDNWTVGFTPEYLVITWVGNNDGTPMNPYLVSGVTGAAPIWNDIMSYVLKGKEAVWPDKPGDVLSAPVCVHGMPPRSGENCQTSGPELYWRFSQPSRSTVVTKETWIRPETGLPPKPGESVDGLVLETKSLYQDPLTDQYCADCNRPVNDQGKIQYEQHVVTSDYQNQSETELTQ